MSRPRRLVAIGGGHGLAVTLEAANRSGADVTAVVTVADDGGSSGRLRRDLGIIAPGDLRRCLEALAPPGLVTEAIGHRFEDGELHGHPPGNVLLAGLLQRSEDVVEAIDALARVMGVRGRVLPASEYPLDLVARTSTGEVVGQVAVGATGGILELGWRPDRPVSPTAVIEAILAADVVTLGPGSLYTSVLAAVVPDVRNALAASPAPVVFVANLAGQHRETAGYDLVDQLDAVARHGVELDAVLVDDAVADRTGTTLEVISCPLRDESGRNHDPVLLAGALERYSAVTVSRDQDPTPYQEPNTR
jgi:uncharacterized cofD-like protein